MIVGYTLFSQKQLPLLCILYNPESGKFAEFPLYYPKTGLSIYTIRKRMEGLQRHLITLMANEQLVLVDFKSWLQGYEIPLYREYLNVYDPMLSFECKVQDGLDVNINKIKKFLVNLAKCPQKEWQRVAANAGIVYAAFERRGILVGHLPTETIWSQATYSGRSKCLGFNIQGATDDDIIHNPDGSIADTFLHFDWRAADIRVAALLSGDRYLDELSLLEDPYQTLADQLNQGASEDEAVTRDECKLRLLQAINSLAVESPLISLFPDLRLWMKECIERLNSGKPLASLLDRKFYMMPGRKPRSLFNATMQGSIAHAMQIVLKKLWVLMPDQLLTEIHDSIVTNVPKDKEEIASTIKAVEQVMCHPFEGYLPSNPRFLVRCSAGKSWKKWKPVHVR